MKQFNVRVDDELYEQAHRQAKEKGISLSDFIREAVRRICQNSETDEMEVLREEVRQNNVDIISLQARVDEFSKNYQDLILEIGRQLGPYNREADPWWKLGSRLKGGN